MDDPEDDRNCQPSFHFMCNKLTKNVVTNNRVNLQFMNYVNCSKQSKELNHCKLSQTSKEFIKPSYMKIFCGSFVKVLSDEDSSVEDIKL